MKTVWVNRHHADGSVKPMSEWVQACVRSETTHVMFEDDRIFQGIRSDTFTSNGRSGIHEYIGNQRGDGWFYVADGDLPLLNELVYTYDGSRLKVDCMARIGISSEPWFADDPDEIVKCWQPIQPPKYLD